MKWTIITAYSIIWDTIRLSEELLFEFRCGLEGEAPEARSPVLLVDSSFLEAGSTIA